LIVPLSHFIEKPFQNWTRDAASVIGAVILYVDYTVPVDRLRAKAEALTRASPLWDKRVFNLQVTDATEQSLQVRVLVSADNAGRAWDLRCEIREKLTAFLRDECPEALPRRRTEVASLPDPSERDVVAQPRAHARASP
jgi:hypothetical protein